MPIDPHRLLDVPGIPESRLPAALLGELPDRVPPAPWTCRFQAVVWWRPVLSGRGAAAAALPEGWGGAVLAVTVGALINYLDSPVGRYREVVGGLALVGPRGPRVHVPFMAVDSPASLVGGRVNWALPKMLAQFAGTPGRSGTATGAGAGWRISATTARRGPAVPVPLLVPLLQRGADRRNWCCLLRGRARAWPARVAVEVRGAPTLTGWFPAGRCWGAVLDSGTLTLGPPHRRIP